MKPTPLSAAKTALALLKQNYPENLCLYAGYYDAIRALEDVIKVETEHPDDGEIRQIMSEP